MADETYYDAQGRAQSRKTTSADDVEDAQTAEKLQSVKAPVGKPVQSDPDIAPSDKSSVQYMIWKKRQDAKAAGQKQALSK